MLIGEVARLAGLSKDGVRHYEQLGLIVSVPRSAGTRIYRDYDASVLVTIDRVRQGQQLGLSLAEIVPLLQAYGDSRLTDADAIGILEERLTAIRTKINALVEIATFIETKLAAYQRGDGAAYVRVLCPIASERH